MGENKTEMSVLDPFIPKHYKGYDMDVLLQRLFDKKQITDEEEQALLEAQSIYRKKSLKKTISNGMNIREHIQESIEKTFTHNVQIR